MKSSTLRNSHPLWTYPLCVSLKRDCKTHFTLASWSSPLSPSIQVVLHLLCSSWWFVPAVGKAPPSPYPFSTHSLGHLVKRDISHSAMKAMKSYPASFSSLSDRTSQLWASPPILNKTPNPAGQAILACVPLICIRLLIIK